MSIAMTPQAHGHVKHLMMTQQMSAHVVRLGVSAGGCSGYSYVLDLVEDTEVNDNDRVFDNDGVRVVCDPKSYLFVNGTTIDFEAMGGGFKFENPNVARACGCGTSFG